MEIVAEFLTASLADQAEGGSAESFTKSSSGGQQYCIAIFTTTHPVTACNPHLVMSTHSLTAVAPALRPL